MAPITTAPPSKAVRYEAWLVTGERASTGANKQTLGNHLSWQELSSSDLALKTETHNVILVIEKGWGMEGKLMAGKRQHCIRASGRPVRNVFTVELSGEHPRCTSELSQPQQRSPLCSACHEALEPNHRNWLSCWEREKRKKRPTSVCSVYLFPYACIDFCFEFHLSLIFSPPPLRIACYFLGVFGSQRYESGGFGPPQTTHYRTDIPLHSAEASLKHLQLCFGGGLKSALTPFMCAHQNPFEVWLLGRMNTHISAIQNTWCVFNWIFKLGRIDSAAPLLLWKHRCCNSWQESPSLTCSDQVVMEIFQLLGKWGQEWACTHILLWLPAVSGKRYLDVWTFIANTYDARRMNPCICADPLTFLLARPAVGQRWVSVKFSDNDIWEYILWLAFNL